MTNTKRIAGLALVLSPLLLQIPFTLLAVRFDYPDILLRDAGEVLTRFHDAGPQMVLTWYLYALCTLGLFAAALTAPTALNLTGTARSLAITTGLIASIAQLLGLLRWVFVVPYLADAWVNHAADQHTLTVLFETQHRLFGVMIGEHVGQLFLALWTITLSMHVNHKALKHLGLASAGLLIIGLGSGLARALPLPATIHHVPLVAFVLWVVWSIGTGVSFLYTRSENRPAAPLHV